MGARAAISFAPRLLRSVEAAAYLGISPSRLTGLPIPHKQDGRCKLYERADLDTYADGIPYVDASVEEARKCDELFGVKG